jgi:hypothetical protein
MAVDLFSLRMNMEVTGADRAAADLHRLEQQGPRTAAALNQGTVQLDRAASAALNGTKGFRDLSAAYAMHTPAVTAASNATLSMTQRMATASGTVIHPMAMAMSTATNAALANQVATAKATQAVQQKGAALSGLTGIMGSSLVRFFAITGAIETMRRTYNAVTNASDDFTKSQISLAGAAKLAGIPVDFLQKASQRAQDTFKISATQANGFVVEVSKLASLAGDVNQTDRVLAALMDTAAGRGMTAATALTAIHQAMLGIDDGTDKLFNKNPSVIWKEWAERMGTTVAKMSEAQKMQALLDETLRAGETLRGSYAAWLETTPGRMQVLDSATNRLAIAFGRIFNPMRDWLADAGAKFLNWLADVVDRYRNIEGMSHGVFRFVMAAMGEGATPKGDPGGFRGDDGMMGASPHPTLAPLTPPKKLTAEEIEKAQREHEAAQRKRLDELMNRFPGGKFTDAADELAFQGFPKRIAPRTGRIDTSGVLSGAGVQGDGETAWDQFEAEQRRQARKVARSFNNLGGDLGTALAQGFGAALAAGIQGKNPFSAFGKAILGGLGSIFTQMGSELIAYGVIMLNLLPFLSNPFTSGPAAIAAGAALVALGSVLGGIATGSKGGKGGSGGSGGLEDKTTRITLTADGLGGRNAPKHDTGGLTVLGVDSPKGQRVLATAMKGAARRNIK